MAKFLHSPKVGDLVYEPFKIQKPGKVIAIRTTETRVWSTVKWIDGTESEVYQLQDFNHATEEHLSKYQKFEKLRNQLKGL